MGKIIKLQINARLKPLPDRLLRAWRSIMIIVQPGNGGQIRADKSRHPVLSPQHIRQKLPVRCHRLSVNGIVGAHRIPCTAVYKGFLEHG